MHLTFLLLFSVDLVITRYPEILSIDPRISCAYCLAIPCHLNTHMDNSRTCRVSAYPQLFMCFTKVFKIIFDLPKILWSLWLLKFLLACIMVNPITLVVLLTFLVIIIFESVDSICLRMHAIFFDPYKLLFRLSCHSFNWNWFWTKLFVVNCVSGIFNLSIPTQSIASDPLFWGSKFLYYLSIESFRCSII